MTGSDTEAEFIKASVAVWREIDQGGPPLDSSVELRQRERAAWEHYRTELDSADPILGPHQHLRDAVAAIEWRIIIQALIKTGSINQAAKLLGYTGHQSLLWILNGRQLKRWEKIKHQFR